MNVQAKIQRQVQWVLFCLSFVFATFGGVRSAQKISAQSAVKFSVHGYVLKFCVATQKIIHTLEFCVEILFATHFLFKFIQSFAVLVILKAHSNAYLFRDHLSHVGVLARCSKNVRILFHGYFSGVGVFLYSN